ncbi:hypothetical protein, partial [Streptomyces sp. st140]|uniref:hypothetical protein n=1 Tax=Streptomyces sp. st140 TaxID=1828052 RepID=UPI00211D221A
MRDTASRAASVSPAARPVCAANASSKAVLRRRHSRSRYRAANRAVPGDPAGRQDRRAQAG